MAIIPIPNQPINLEPYVGDSCRRTWGSFCQKLTASEILYFQFKQTTCGSNLIADGNFNGLSAEMLANPSFTGSAASWTLGAGWAYSTNAIVCTPGSSAGFAQTGLTITAGRTYQVSITSTGATQGTIYAVVGGVTTASTVGNDTFTFFVTAVSNGSSLTFTNDTLYDGTVTECSLKLVASDWDVDAGYDYTPTGSSLADGMYCHVPGTNDDLEQTVAYINAGYYYITFSVSNRTAGTLSISIGGTALTYTPRGGTVQSYIDANGTYTLYGYAASTGVLRFRSDSEFNGCIGYVSSYELEPSFNYQLLNTDGSVASTQPAAWNETIFEDKVLVDVSMTGVSYGCYNIEVVDPCEATYAANVVPDPTIASPGTWTHTNEAGDDTGQTSVTIPTGAITMTVDGPTRIVSESYKQLVSGLTNGVYRLSFTIGHIDSNLQHGGGNVLNFYLGSINYAVAMAAVAGSTTYTANVPVLFLTGTNDQVKVQFTRINEGFCSGGEYVEVTSVYYQKVSGGTLVSNCLNVTDDFKCEKQLIGICDSGYDNLGFYWDGNFKLQQWVPFLYFNPFHPVDAGEYEYSTGIKSTTQGRKEKFYEGDIGYVDETTHDVIPTMGLCDTFTVDGINYYIKPDDYKPDYETKNGELIVSKARVQMRKKQSTIFKTKY